METIVSPIGRGQGHELINKLEAAGLDSTLAQRVIDSKNNDLAAKVVRFIQNGEFEATTSQKRAREIMGRNMFGIEEAIKHFGVNPTRQQVAALADIPFAERPLLAGEKSVLQHGEGRLIGDRFAFHDTAEKEQILDVSFFQRQVLAFGEPLQRLPGRLHIGIAGLGGTGSAIHEQLVRLGVGTITACDPQAFERTNINRVYGSRTADDGVPKIEIARRSSTDIGLATRLQAIEGSITDLHVARAFRECDIIFGCTDDEWGRAVLTKLAAAYLIPIFDLGAQILSDNGVIKSVRGRVTTLAPNSPCLFCRGVVSGRRHRGRGAEQDQSGRASTAGAGGICPRAPGTCACGQATTVIL